MRRAWLRRRPERHADERTSSFFVDAVDAAPPPAPGDAARRASQWLMVAIALATALGVAGLFGLLPPLRP